MITGPQDGYPWTNKRGSLFWSFRGKPDEGWKGSLGWITLNQNRGSSGWYVSQVAVHEDFRRRGISSALHDAAFDFVTRKGETLRSGMLTSNEAKLYWKKLVARGQAEETPGRFGMTYLRLESMGPFEQQCEQLLFERAPTAIMYHGTSGKNLRSIMSKGLVPTGVDKAWADDPDASWIQPSRASLGGIYLTHNIMTAVSSSGRGGGYEGGERIIVVCQIQPRSLLADEDDFMHTINKLQVSQVVTDWGLLHLYLSSLGQGQSDRESDYLREYDKHRKDWVKEKSRSILFGLKGEAHPQLEKRLQRILYDGFPAVIKRRAAYMADRHVRVQVSDARKVNFDLPSKSDGERGFRDMLEKLTRTMKQLSQRDKRSSDFNVSGRLMKPIGFRGANKIVGIFKFFQGADDKTQIETVFGKIPFMTIHDWEQKMGEWRVAA